MKNFVPFPSSLRSIAYFSFFVWEISKHLKGITLNDYDSKVRYPKLEVCDRVLVRNVSVGGTCKNNLDGKWERNPNLDLPVFKVQQEGNKGPRCTLHRTLLLPFMSMGDSL